MADEGRPTFDLSSFTTFAFPSTVPEGSTEVVGIQSAESYDNEGPSVPNAVQGVEEASMASEDANLVDLTKFGPPDALTQLHQPIPRVVFNIVYESIDAVRAQVQTEHEVRRRIQDREENEQVADGRQVDKGKGVAAPQAMRRPSQESSAASHRANDQTPPFYTPSEGQTPSANTESDAGTEALTAVVTTVDNDLSLRPTQRPKSSSTSSIPRRRDLIKAMFRKKSDSDTQRQPFPKSAGGMQLKTKLKHVRQIWRGEPVFSECISCFDEFVTYDLIRLPCHYYCRPCFNRLIAYSIESESNWPPKCCLHPIPHRKCLKYISAMLTQKYLQKHREYTAPIGQRYYCPVPDCGVFVRVNTKQIAYREQRCSKGHLTCVDCRNWAHKDAALCPQNKDMLNVLQTMALDEGWRRCFRCNTMIEHQSMCRHITCRCGAQFCYVCGKVWWTCGCTERQLESIKSRAKQNAAKRKAQEEREKREAQELRVALERIAKEEAERAVKLEMMRQVKEEQRKRQVRNKYEGYATIMDELNDFQRSLLDGEHRRDQDHLTLKTLDAVIGLQRKHAAKMEQFKASSEAKIKEKMKDLEQTWLNRIAEELEAGREEVHRVEWNPVQWNEDNKTGELELLEVRTSEKKADTLERIRYVLEEEVAIQQELMDAKTARVTESFEVQAQELRGQMRSQLRWLDLVVAERNRLLDESKAVELADELLNDKDDRWNAIITREDLVEAGSSRFRRGASNATQQQGLLTLLSSQHGSDAGPSSPRPEASTREPTPPPWNPLSLGSELHAAWDSTWETWWNPRGEAEDQVSELMTAPPRYSPRNEHPSPVPPGESARAVESLEGPVPPTPLATPSEDRPPTPAPWISLLDTIGDFLLEAPPGGRAHRA